MYETGTVIEFGHNVTYKCKHGHFFEEDYDMQNFTLMCLPDGNFTSPVPWKQCLDPRSKCHYAVINENCMTWGHFAERYCPDPPDPHENGGLYDWDENLADVTPYDTYVTYSCDTARQFLNSSVTNVSDIYAAIYPTQIRHCEWDQTWSPSKEVSWTNLLLDLTLFVI